MARHALAGILLVAIGCGSSVERVANPDTSSPDVRRGDVPRLTLKDIPETPPAEIQRIRSLIRELANIDSPDYGLSPAISGCAFLPIPGHTTLGAILRSSHAHRSSDALRALVELGPKALSYLLESLDDITPTRLKIHGSDIGGTRFADEVPSNPISLAEQSVLQARPQPDRWTFPQNIEEYTVKVGDVCFVAIGQIVGRAYQCVRYQPSGNIVINSPTRDPRLRAEVRAIWSSEKPHQTVLDSLLLDFSTQGIFNGESLDGWDLGSRMQTESVLRLLYYFPRQSAALVAERLSSLDVSARSVDSDASLDTFIRREVKNGVRTREFIKATLWFDIPAIEAAIRDIEGRSDDPEILAIVRQARGRAE